MSEPRRAPQAKIPTRANPSEPGQFFDPSGPVIEIPTPRSIEYKIKGLAWVSFWLGVLSVATLALAVMMAVEMLRPIL